MASGPGTPVAAGTTDDKQLRRLRWAVRATLVLGVAASVAANVLHARPNPISQIIAAWPPLALLLTVELISRVPHHRRLLGAIRIAATSVIAAIATWVSYWHLAGVAARYGETEHGGAYLLPISVDGLVIVASVSLVEITAKIRTTMPPPSPPAPTHTPSPPINASAAAPAAPSDARPVARASDTATTNAPARLDRPSTVSAMPSHAAAPITAEPDADSASTSSTPRHRPHDDNGPHQERAVATLDNCAPKPETDANLGDVGGLTPPQTSSPSVSSIEPTAPAGDERTDNVPADTAAAVAYWRRRDPELPPADIAARIGKSERTVYRYWSPPMPNDNGHPADSLRH
ncbi:DUF2637 domain-containing protein [Micromonospora sp. STR1s_6]|uniref:DUF2637 domain-containing protein n=1 Tax=Micromonospora tarensis TaxID=2806100 RepID=A0ABS1Y9E3_9ACTN|nr:DUF2637 domain-containing protein [Micromonospora tarensis]MBM0274007.1 DUF2637 domain-containing protein [Micromonospora tarensis]